MSATTTTKTAILERLLVAMDRDSWCQECAVQETIKEMAKILQEEGIEVPAWIEKRLIT